MPGCCARGPGRSPGARSPRNISASAAARGRAGRHPPGGSPLSLPCPPFDGCRSELLRARAGLDDERPRLPEVLGGAETLGTEEAQMRDGNLEDDRTSVGYGKSESVRVDLVDRRRIKKKKASKSTKKEYRM